MHLLNLEVRNLMNDSTLYTLSTFPTWATAMTFAISYLVGNKKTETP